MGNSVTVVAFLGLTYFGSSTRVGLFSCAAPRLLRQTADRPSAILSIVRPVRAEIDARRFEIDFASPPVLMISQRGLSFSESARRSVHSPFSFLPERKIVSAPFQKLPSTVSYVPISQIMTVPPPYSPSGIMPSNCR